LYRGDPGVIGKVIRVDDVPREIVGVLLKISTSRMQTRYDRFASGPPKSGIPEPWVFLPIALDYSKLEWNGNFGNWVALGRLAPGIDVRQATVQLKQYPGSVVAGNESQRRVPRVAAADAAGDRGRFRRRDLVTDGECCGLMLIACLNLANAQLGRALTQRRDAAVRAALGAAKWRLLWSALAENLLLACIGGALGVLLAYAGLAMFRRYSPINVPRLSEIRLNFAVLSFSLAVTVAASLISGMLPGLRLLFTDPQVSLQQGGARTFGSRSSQRLRLWLIGFQVFGCTVLLLVTGLFSKSLLHLLRQDNGFETTQAAIAEVRPAPSSTARRPAACR
jgi:hypothetical protein